MYKIGLIGENLKYSFSKKYFDEKFKKECLHDFSYELYEINSIENFKNLLHIKNLIGLNITSPYKQSIIKYINKLDHISQKIKAVNTIFIDKVTSKIIGYNTDVYGFRKSLEMFLPKSKIKALVLGNGGASKAICYVLKKQNIDYLIVSRKPKGKNMISYKKSNDYIEKHKFIINTTILGSKKSISNYPNINYNLISKNHYIYDLIYNPKKTLFLKKSQQQGAHIMNGESMLILQAELSFQIWKKQIKKI